MPPAFDFAAAAAEYVLAFVVAAVVAVAAVLHLAREDMLAGIRLRYRFGDIFNLQRIC